MRSLVLLLAASAVGLGCASHRWVSGDPVVLHSPNPSRELIARVVIDVRASGYAVQEYDISLGFVRARAKTTDGVIIGIQTLPSTTNFFTIQLDPAGSIIVRADGDLVRDGGAVMHRTLREEFDFFVGIVGDAIMKNRAGPEKPAQSL